MKKILALLLVLFVLPSVLVLGDSIINRTSFRIRVPEPTFQKAEGAIRVRGHIHGYVSGMVNANVDGVIQGRLEASVSTGGEIREGGEENA